jgi:hypothetical protein
MPVLTDEIVLNVDGFVLTDPANSVRQRAQQFLASRRWTTDQIFYGDQAEPEEEGIGPMWSFCFNIGLDKIDITNGKWRDDVHSLVGFLKELQAETNHDIVMDVRFRSKPWYSGHIAYIDEKCTDIDTICEMIERVANSTGPTAM